MVEKLTTGIDRKSTKGKSEGWNISEVFIYIINCPYPVLNHAVLYVISFIHTNKANPFIFIRYCTQIVGVIPSLHHNKRE